MLQSYWDNRRVPRHERITGIGFWVCGFTVAFWTIVLSHRIGLRSNIRVVVSLLVLPQGPQHGPLIAVIDDEESSVEPQLRKRIVEINAMSVMNKLTAKWPG